MLRRPVKVSVEIDLADGEPKRLPLGDSTVVALRERRACAGGYVGVSGSVDDDSRPESPPSGLALGNHAHDDGVLHDRLQHQAGHGRVQHVGRDMDARGQAVTKASPLDAQVQLQQFQFAAQRDFLAVVVLQERAQQFAQAQSQRLAAEAPALFEEIPALKEESVRTNLVRYLREQGADDQALGYIDFSTFGTKIAFKAQQYDRMVAELQKSKVKLAEKVKAAPPVASQSRVPNVNAQEKQTL